jgi:hypothetical protein
MKREQLEQIAALLPARAEVRLAYGSQEIVDALVALGGVRFLIPSMPNVIDRADLKIGAVSFAASVQRRPTEAELRELFAMAAPL